MPHARPHLVFACLIVAGACCVIIDKTAAEDTPDSSSFDLSSLPQGVSFTKHLVTSAGPMTLGSSASTTGTTNRLVYSNTLGEYVLSPNPGVRIADDIATVARFGCTLKRFVFRVTGDRYNDRAVDEGPFTVTYALYPTCPGSTVCQSGDDFCPTPIGGTSGQITLADDGFHEIVVDIPDQVCLGGLHDGSTCQVNSDCEPTCEGGDNDGLPCVDASECPGGGDCPLDQVGTCGSGVSLPSSFFLGLSFDRSNAGVVVGAPALVGYSADRYDAGSFACAAAFGQFPAFPHASFFAEVYVDDTCPTQFPAYHNSMQAGPVYSAGAQKLFADDITLGVDAKDCNMVAYEVGLKGTRTSTLGGLRVDLYTRLSETGEDPLSTGIIPGTRMERQVIGRDVQLVRRTFSPPIRLSDYLSNAGRSLFAVFRSSSSEVGPINTCRDADPGSTEDLAYRYVGDPPDGEWAQFDLGGSCHSAFEVTIYCEGHPPIGACCDMQFPENKTCYGGPNDGQSCGSTADCGDGGHCAGDSVCRDVPLWNCPFPELWEEGTHCGPTCSGGDNDSLPCASDAACPAGQCTGSFCVGGDNDGLPCTRAMDCPNGECAGGPFAHACGVSACCSYESLCTDVTERECYSRSPDDPGELFFRNEFCENGTFECPNGVCVAAVGDCSLTHDGRGCGDGGCCEAVCDFDTFCCSVAWDNLCVVWSQAICRIPPSNDSCYDPISGDGAYELALGDNLVVASGLASNGSSEPPFCCPNLEAPNDGKGKVWFRFTVPEPSSPNKQTVSLELSTCGSSNLQQFGSSDSILQVFAAPNADQGRCDDGSSCSVGANDCLDGSTCAYDQQAACQSLAPLACNDDAVDSCAGPNGSTDPRHARQCLPNLTPGDVYYVMVAAKSVNDVGAIQLNLTEGCTPTDPPMQPNDICTAATSLVGDDVSIPFDFSGGDSFMPATVDCLDQMCGADAVGDIWFNWTAPSDGIVTIDACMDDPTTEAPIFAVYGGCDCRLFSGDELGCGEPISTANCENGVESRVVVEGGKCYKVRLSGVTQGLDLAGLLSIRHGLQIPNDLCASANELLGNDTTAPFDLSGGADYQPAHLDGVAPSCAASMTNDVWYEWTAPSKGVVSMDICGADANEDAYLVIYDSCGCPADDQHVVACIERTDAFCEGTTFFTNPGCYTVRVGGLNSTSSGNLAVHFEQRCPAEPVQFVDPPAGARDVRQPFPLTDESDLQTIDSLTIRGSSASAEPSCWSFCEVGFSSGLPDIHVADVRIHTDGTFTLLLDRHMLPGRITAVTYTDINDVATTTRFSVLPADVNLDGLSDFSDVAELLNILNGVSTSPWGLYGEDIDRSGALGPADLLRLIDVLRGGGEYGAGWYGRRLLPDQGECPN